MAIFNFYNINIMQHFGIIGGGFSGIVLAIQLIEQSQQSIEISIFEEKALFCKGIAYTPYSKKHILNVPAAKMSAFPDRPNHYLDWLMEDPEYKTLPKDWVGASFTPRYLYGAYLEHLWESYNVLAETKNIKINTYFELVSKIDYKNNVATIQTEKGNEIKVDQCIIATGNMLPSNPNVADSNILKSPLYFQNPWQENSVKNINQDLPILIIGNGLTMVDTVIGLLENQFENKIYTISPNGFNILPHRHNGMQYTQFIEEYREDMNLKDLVHLFRKHIKQVRSLGVSAEPIIDSFRPYTQKVWQRFSDSEKSFFMRKLRHAWGVARHRIPLHIHDKLQKLQIDLKLKMFSGRISGLSLTHTENAFDVKFYNKKTKKEEQITVGRIINCTGPDSNLDFAAPHFLYDLKTQGVITQDFLKLGIEASPISFETINQRGEINTNLYVIGSHLKGKLWESTAVNELRTQAKLLAEKLLQN
jgi:uncharacterized NAD(P)/FAD-binding protein YdhS